MKKIVILMFAVSVAIALTGCTIGSNNTDNADSGLIDSTGSSGVMSPPVPPEPTR
jgi:hypothetical protein